MAKSFGITFGEHLPGHQIASLTSQLAAYGLLAETLEPFDIVIDVRRTSHLRGLMDQLTAWERQGLLRWSEISN